MALSDNISITLDQAKAELRVQHDGSNDEIDDLVADACDYVENVCLNHDFTEDGTVLSPAIPRTVRRAVLRLVTHWYYSRRVGETHTALNGVTLTMEDPYGEIAKMVTPWRQSPGL